LIDLKKEKLKEALLPASLGERRRRKSERKKKEKKRTSV
jgi:hypothetical protein